MCQAISQTPCCSFASPLPVPTALRGPDPTLGLDRNRDSDRPKTGSSTLPTHEPHLTEETYTGDKEEEGWTRFRGIPCIQEEKTPWRQQSRDSPTFFYGSPRIYPAAMSTLGSSENVPRHHRALLDLRGFFHGGCDAPAGESGGTRAYLTVYGGETYFLKTVLYLKNN